MTTAFQPGAFQQDAFQIGEQVCPGLPLVYWTARGVVTIPEVLQPELLPATVAPGVSEGSGPDDEIGWSAPPQWSRRVIFGTAARTTFHSSPHDEWCRQEA